MSVLRKEVFEATIDRRRPFSGSGRHSLWHQVRNTMVD